MERISSILSRVPFFRDLSPQELHEIATITIERICPKKMIVFSEGAKKEAVFFIHKGLIKVYKTDINGHELIVNFLKSGDMFPHTGFFNQNPYPGTAEAVENCHLLAIPVQAFEKLMLSNPVIAIKVMSVMGEKIRQLQSKLQEITGLDVQHRILAILLDLAENHSENKEGIINLTVPITNQEIANMIGSTRETVNRILNQLRKHNIVDMQRNEITILDYNALLEWAES